MTVDLFGIFIIAVPTGLAGAITTVIYGFNPVSTIMTVMGIGTASIIMIYYSAH
jgi:hypothetical protein